MAWNIIKAIAFTFVFSVLASIIIAVMYPDSLIGQVTIFAGKAFLLLFVFAFTVAAVETIRDSYLRRRGLVDY